MRPLIWLLSAHPGRALRSGLVRALLGVECGVCGEYLRGPRTLYAHGEREHPGEAAA